MQKEIPQLGGSIVRYGCYRYFEFGYLECGVMDIEKDSNREAFESWFESRYDAHFMQFALDLDMYADKHTQTSWEAWQAAKALAVPKGFVLTKKRNMIGNPNVDWSQAPKWAKYWLKDGHSNKYWWSSIRPVKDMDINAFCWKGDFFVKEAPDFSFSGAWDKSLTSRKNMIEAQGKSHD